MFFLLFGSSASGKSFVLDLLREREPGLAIHDFDEIGVPSGATMGWRQEANELWVLRALDHQAGEVDLLLAGQTPFGELLATPSATRLESISACLLDCDDTTRTARLRARGSAFFSRADTELQNYLGWAEWMRNHVRDPAWRPFVIRRGSSEEMRWERWSDWEAGDRRWRIAVIDTSELPVEAVADELSVWIADERALFAAGTHPLRLGSWAVGVGGKAS